MVYIDPPMVNRSIRKRWLQWAKTAISMSTRQN